MRKLSSILVLILFGMATSLSSYATVLGETKQDQSNQESKKSKYTPVTDNQLKAVGERKDAYYFGLMLGPSFGLGDYGKSTSGLEQVVQFNIDLFFSAKVYQGLAVRADCGGFGYNGKIKGTDATGSFTTGYLAIGAEYRFDLSEKSQLSLMAGIGSASAIARASSGTSSVEVTNNGSVWMAGANFRTPLTSRVAFIGSVKYVSARMENATSNIEAINPAVGIIFNFAK